MGQEEYDLDRYGTREAATATMNENPMRSMVWDGWKDPMDAFDGYAYPGGAARMFALMLTLPVLNFFADVMGLVGGALMAWSTLGINPDLFFNRLHDAVGMRTFFVGLVKAPVFAALIAMVGCYEGLRVKRDAESVGRLTTRSVVQSIFLVIVFDALFSIMFNFLEI